MLRMFFKGSLVILFVLATAGPSVAQDEGWIDSLTVNGEPPPPQARLVPRFGEPLKAPVERGVNGNIARALRTLFSRPLAQAQIRPSDRRMLPSSSSFGASRPSPFVRRSAGVLRGGSPLGTTELRCAGGARSGNPDADVTVYIGISVEGSGIVAQNQATGYSPNTVALTTIANTGVDRRLECVLTAGGAQAQATGTILADCGDDELTFLRGEYYLYATTTKPPCNEFTQSVPGLSHYSFEDWKAPNWSWALLQTSVTSNTYCVVNNHGSTPAFSSGYRNPVHNANEGGAVNSRHIYGDAVDLTTPAHPNNTLYDSLRFNAKNGNCSVACVEPRLPDSPAHYHADYRPSGCPPGW